MIDRLTSMAVFVRTAETGSFTKAAKALGMSPQMAGKHLNALEEHFGTTLLNRTTRRQSLTEAGRIFLTGCRRVLAEAEATDARALAKTEAPRGVLRVSASITLGTCWLAREMTAFQTVFPDVSLDLVLKDRLVDIIEEGFDVALRIGHLPDSSLIARSLAPYRIIPCAAPSYIERHGKPDHPSELVHHDCLVYAFPAHPAPIGWTFTDGSDVVHVDPPERTRIDDGRALIAAALAGGGIVLAGEPNVADDIAAGRLVRLLEGWRGPERPVHLVFPAGRPLPPKQRVFIDWMMQTFGATR